MCVLVSVSLIEDVCERVCVSLFEDVCECVCACVNVSGRALISCTTLMKESESGRKPRNEDNNRQPRTVMRKKKTEKVDAEDFFVSAAVLPKSSKSAKEAFLGRNRCPSKR